MPIAYGILDCQNDNLRTLSHYVLYVCLRLATLTSYERIPLLAYIATNVRRQFRAVGVYCLLLLQQLLLLSLLYHHHKLKIAHPCWPRLTQHDSCKEWM